MSITINYLQKYLKLKDYNPEVKEQYFMKLSEEVGELSRSMLKNQRMTDGRVKGTIEEELWDVIYYAIAIANLYKIDLEEVIPLKEKLNNEKHQTGINFGDEV